MMLHRFCTTAWLFVGAVLLAGCSKGPQPGAVLDEAKQAGRDGASFQHSAEDYFHDMDGGVALDAGGDRGPQHVAGLERRQRPLLEQHDRLHLRRLRPAEDRQLAPQPGLLARQPLELLRPGQRALLRASDAAPDKNRRGLWLDVRGKDCAPDPFENESKYPGVAIGARGKPLGDGTTQPVGSFYGYATGIVGPAPVPQSRPSTRRPPRHWDPEHYYTDPSYYNRKDLVRPYRVGMSCGFCHVGPSPVKPPADPENPEVRKPQLVGGRAVHVGGPALHLQREQARGPHELHVPARPHLPAGHAWTPRWSRPTASTTRAR